MKAVVKCKECNYYWNAQFYEGTEDTLECKRCGAQDSEIFIVEDDL